nr:ATP-dependent DNA helicase RecQ [Legionellales bacterium]
RDLSEQAWLSVFRQLIHLGYLIQDINRYSILLLTEKAKPLLRDELSLMLAKPRVRLTKTNKKTSQTKGTVVTSKAMPADDNPALFEQLKKLRKTIADRDNVPPFIVFSDATLIEMSSYLPKDKQSMLAINGVGEYKLKAYGTEFLAEIEKFVSESK